jgi:hypothetical protein
MARFDTAEVARLMAYLLVSGDPYLVTEASDPATSQARLAELAHQHPELRSTIASNPSCYDELRLWIADHPGTTVGALLRHLGLRKSTSEPTRLYKVTIFDVASTDLCRPLDGKNENDEVAGVYACSSGGRPTNLYSGCGYTTDASDGKRALDLFRVEWRDAAAEGFCVLPAQRFVEQAGK